MSLIEYDTLKRSNIEKKNKLLIIQENGSKILHFEGVWDGDGRILSVCQSDSHI